MGEHFADDVDVGTGTEQKGSVGVAEAVECDVFFYACVFYPVVKFFLDEGICEAFEDLSFARCSAEFHCFFGNWE